MITFFDWQKFQPVPEPKKECRDVQPLTGKAEKGGDMVFLEFFEFLIYTVVRAILYFNSIYLV